MFLPFSRTLCAGLRKCQLQQFIRKKHHLKLNITNGYACIGDIEDIILGLEQTGMII